jgi:hypothetical protein
MTPKVGQADFSGNYGLDWFSFQTQIRKLVMEMIEPTVKRSYEDHISFQSLSVNHDKLKKDYDEFKLGINKTVLRLVDMEDLSRRL